MPNLIITVGLPRSGKTTWAREQVYPIVNPDSIRLALHGKRFEPLAEDFVWATCFVMIKALLLAGHDTVIVDATHTTTKRRRPYLDRFPDCKVIFKVFDTDKKECVRRALSINDKEIIPIIRKMADQFEKLTVFELGFNA